jgi:integrase
MDQEPRLFEYSNHWLVLRPDTPNYYIYWCRPGTRAVRRRSTGTTDLDLARRRLIAFADQRNQPSTFTKNAEAVLHLADTPTAANKAASVPLLDVLCAHVERLHQERRPSLASAKTCLRHWQEFCTREDIVWVSEVSIAMQDRFIAWRQSKLGKSLGSNGTINRDLSILKAGLRDAWKHGTLSAPPYVKSLPNPPPRDRFLTADEAQRLIAACDDPVTKRFVLLALHTLQRPKAIFELKTFQVDLERGRIDFRPSRAAASNKRYPVVPITPTLVTELEQAIGESVSGHVLERNGRPLQSMRKAFARAAERAGLRNCTPYVLRHTGATLAAAAGVSMRQIAGMLGHTSQKITETVYAKHQPEFLKDMARTLDDLFGVPESAKGSVVAVTGNTLQAKWTPANGSTQEPIQENLKRRAA